MYIYSPDRFSSHGLGKEALVATLLRWICRPSFELVIYITWWADLQKRFVKLTNTWNLCILVERGINFWDSEPPGAPWPPGVPDASQMPPMPPRCLPDASQMPLRCLSDASHADASQMPPRCLLPPWFLLYTIALPCMHCNESSSMEESEPSINHTNIVCSFGRERALYHAPQSSCMLSEL